MPSLSRRRFLIAGLLFAAGCRPSDRPRPTIYAPSSPESSRAAPEVTPTIPRTLAAVDLPPLPTAVPLTPVARLYEKSIRGTPDLSKADDWQLTIDGLVNQPLTVTRQQIQAMPHSETMRTLQCISNPVGGGLIGNLIWSGVALAPLLEQVGILEAARYVHFEAADGYTTSVKTEWLTQSGVLLIDGVIEDGQRVPLPPEHGHPLRILIPGLYGQKMPKWITRLTFAAEDKLGYWEGPAYEWSNEAVIKTSSAIRSPSRSPAYREAIRVEGWAFSGLETITRIEISVDAIDAPAPSNWQPAMLIPPPTPLAWTWFGYDWRPSVPGVYRVAVRATDSTRFTQSVITGGLFGQAFPDGTDAIHRITLNLSER